MIIMLNKIGLFRTICLSYQICSLRWHKSH